MEPRSDSEKLARLREVLSAAEWAPTDTRRMRLELQLVLDDKLTEYDQLQLQPDAARVRILARPGSYRTHNITDGSRTAYLTLSVEGGHVPAHVEDAYVSSTAVLLTGRAPCLVTGIVEHIELDDGSRETRLLVRLTDPAPPNTPQIRPFMEIVGGSKADPDVRETMLKIRKRLSRQLLDIDRRISALDEGEGPEEGT